MAYQDGTPLPLTTILEEEEASEPSDPNQPGSLPWPTRRRAFNGARPIRPAPGASPSLIEPILNSMPPSHDEFDDILDGGLEQDTRRAKENSRRENVDHLIKFINFSIRDTIPVDDGIFDVVYASEIMSHLPSRAENDVVIKVLTEMKRVTKPSGIVASHDIAALHFFPNHRYQLDDLVERTLFKAADDEDWVAILPSLLAKGTRLRARWISAGINETTIETVLERLRDWSSERYSWHMRLYTDMVAQKGDGSNSSSEVASSLDFSLSSSGSDSGRSSTSTIIPRASFKNAPDPGSPHPNGQFLDDQFSTSDVPVSNPPVPDVPVSNPPVPDVPVSDPLVPDPPVQETRDRAFSESGLCARASR
ncbi:hypothetical protein F4803DRAFT_547079 [Xylaria telfairii]|nr:hypothetical protein F4803DRAFT_547079 [Xylaria telfairii]